MDVRETFRPGGTVGGRQDPDPQALRLAVIARIRHEHTPSDQRLMEHGDRSRARAEVRAEIEQVLQQ